MSRRSPFVLCLCLVASSAAVSAAPALALRSGRARPALAVTAKKAPLKCATRTIEGKAFRLCGGQLRGEDGSNGLVVTKDRSGVLDTDVTLPGKGRGPFPLVVLLHGLGGSRESFESDTIAGEGGSFHMNNLWFASRGYAVLNYTARGFHDSACRDESVQSVDADPQLYGDSPACLPQLDNVRHEIADTRYLVSKLIDGGLIDAGVDIKRKVGVGGVSYGGGHTWMLVRKNTWKTPRGTKVKVGAAVPIIGWTDLLDAVAPNGRAGDGTVSRDSAARLAEPPGVMKFSFVQGFYLLMKSTSTKPFTLPDYIERWYQQFNAGEPYSGDPVIEDAMLKLITERSAHYIGSPRFNTPVLDVQGFTDQMFPVSQALREYNSLKAADPSYPIRLYFGDWGHPISQNKADETAYIARLANRFLDFYIKGKGRRPAAVAEARTTVCGPDLPMGDLYRAGTYAELQGDVLPADVSALVGTLDAAAIDAHADELTPVHATTPFPGGDGQCRTTDSAVAPGNLAASIPLPGGLTMLGLPTVTLTADPTGDDMYVAAHLWDVDGDGAQTLVDRGVFRLDGTAAQDITFQLFGNAYDYAPGHELKLELTANDSPSFKQYTFNDMAGGSIEVSDVTLSIPTANEAALVP